MVKLIAFSSLMVFMTASAAAQNAPPADRSQDMAWHSQQQLALASRGYDDGWSYLDGGVLWRRVAGDGAGPSPDVSDTVTVQYEGTFVDGTVFDSSYSRDTPATFPLRGLIRAWQLAIPQMGIGDTIEIAVPASMGYGATGKGPIPGGATLLFKIELLDIAGR